MFTHVRDVVPDLKLPELEILYPDQLHYTVLTYQPEGKVTGGNTYVRNQDQSEAYSKCIKFFELAKKRNVSLAVTPEYSCPWSVIDLLLTEDKFPNDKKIWVIGAESITLDELNNFKNKFQSKYEVNYEDLEGKPGNFVDPVCYFFNTEDSQSWPKKMILIQFKTVPLGDSPDHFERDNLILGSKIYQFEGRSAQSIIFSTLICSDVLNITKEQLDPVLTRSLILHIQLNKNPRSETYSLYRKFCLGTKNPDCDVITLNWAENVFCAETNPQNWNNIGGSGIYFKTAELDKSDERINKNHHLGMYLTNFHVNRSYVYYFNFKENVFFFRNLKVFQHYNSAQGAGRSGPEMLNVYSWSSADWTEQQQLDDGFIMALSEVKGSFSAIRNLANRPIDIERHLSLSTGLAKDEKWKSIEALKFFKIESLELIHRISFAQDKHPDVVADRNSYLSKYAVLEQILKNQNYYPITIQDMFNDCYLSAPAGNLIRNLMSDSGGAPATVVYIGEHPANGVVESVYASLMEILAKEKKDKYRVVIWYRHGTDRIKFYPENIEPEADIDPEEHPASITRS
jgi:hypothetical protein